VFSPPLDARGNSVRGVAVCEAISQELELHFLRAPRPSISAVRSRETLATFGSKRVRFDSERAVLAAHGGEAIVYRLQGELSFAGSEAVIRRLVREGPRVTHFVLDFGRVMHVDSPSGRLLLELCTSLVSGGRTLAFSGMNRLPRLVRLLEEERARDPARPLAVFDDLELALEWVEEALLAAHGAAVDRHLELPLARHDFLRGLDADQLERISALMHRKTCSAREMVVRKDAVADELFLLVGGALSVLSDLPDGRMRRLAALSPGMGFGETAVLDGVTRTAFVRADRASTCWVLKRADFDALGASDPQLQRRLLENLLRSATRSLGRMNVEVAAETA